MKNTILLGIPFPISYTLKTLWQKQINDNRNRFYGCNILCGVLNKTHKPSCYQSTNWRSGSVANLSLIYIKFFDFQKWNFIHKITYSEQHFTLHFFWIFLFKDFLLVNHNLLYTILEIKLQNLSLNWITYPLTTLIQGYAHISIIWKK